MQNLNFKAAVLFKQKQKLRIIKIRPQKTLLKGQVLVKIMYSGICGSQLGEISGVKGKDNFLPHLLGHEGTGIVKKLGPGVKYFKFNDKVILHWKKSKGIEAKNPIYYFKNNRINSGKVTTFSEFSVVSENRLTKIPKGLSYKDAVIFGCAATTGFGIVNRDVKIKKNKSSLIFGCGGVGINISQAASINKSYPIITIDKFAKRIQFTKKHGASHTIKFNGNFIDLRKKILQILKNKPLDFFIDTTGNTKVIEFGLEIINPNNGNLVLVGVQKKNEKISLNTLQLMLGKKIIGTHGGNCQPNIDISKIYQSFKKNNIQISNFYTKTYSLDKINKAISDMKNGNLNGRCLIKMHS